MSPKPSSSTLRPILYEEHFLENIELEIQRTCHQSTIKFQKMAFETIQINQNNIKFLGIQKEVNWKSIVYAP